MKATELYFPSEAAYRSAKRNKITARFISWCDGQESSRMLWAGSSLALHGCVLTPLTMAAVIFAGLNPVLLALTAISIMLTLVINLAAVPMRNAIPVFCISLLINLGVIASCIITGMHLAKFF